MGALGQLGLLDLSFEAGEPAKVLPTHYQKVWKKDFSWKSSKS
jgi:hypothetical protein